MRSIETCRRNAVLTLHFVYAYGSPHAVPAFVQEGEGIFDDGEILRYTSRATICLLVTHLPVR